MAAVDFFAQLSPDIQADIKKMSTARITARLLKAGVEEDTVSDMDRNALIQAWSQCIVEGRDKSKPSDPQTMLLQFEKWKFEREREERDARERREHEERQREREERAAREIREREERQRDRELRERELQLHEDELRRAADRDKRDRERRESLASRSKFFGEVLKNILWKFPNDAADIPVFFDHIEHLFEVYEVPEDIQARLLQAQLTEKAKALTARLSKDQSADYGQLKEFLLNEYRLTPQQYRQRFVNASRFADETCTLFASRLKNMLLYYLRGRGIKDDFDQFVSLTVADRLKATLPEHCLKFVLAQEGDSWLPCDKLAHVVDVYMNSHFGDGRPRGPGSQPTSQVAGPDKPPQASQASNAGTFNQKRFPTSTSGTGPACFECHSRSHKVKDCPQRKAKLAASRHNTGANVGSCAVEPMSTSPESFPQVSIELRTQDAIDIRASSGVKLAVEDDSAVTCTEGVHVRNASGAVTRTRSCDIPGCECVDADAFHNRTFISIEIEDMPPRQALVDGGAEVCCIDAELVKHLNPPVVEQIKLTGLLGKGGYADVVRLHTRPVIQTGMVSVAPPIYVWFAIVHDFNEECGIILTPSVVDLLNDAAHYAVMAAPGTRQVSIPSYLDDGLNSSSTEELLNAESTIRAAAAEVSTDAEYLDVEHPLLENESVADHDKLVSEQKACSTLAHCWIQAKEHKAGLFIENELLYHRDTVLGQKVKQLVLPESRRDVVLRMGHDAAFAGHLSVRKTRQRIRLSFWFPKMDGIIGEYCATCEACQRKAPLRTSDRVPITPIPRDDELPFSHLVMDCIGPIIADTDPVVSKPKYNYALVICDRFTRWPMAYPLRNMSAKAVCDALIQVFMTFSIPMVISSDCGSNFTSSLTKEFLTRLGCSPRFNTPGHPEASGIVERCNATLKAMIGKLVHDDPRGWWNLLPYVLWALREVPNETTGVAPFTLLYGTLPRGPLSSLKSAWEGEVQIPLCLGKGPVEYLQTLKENLEIAQAYARTQANKELQRYATHYNLRSKEKQFQVGDHVVVLVPDSANKVYSRWQGPGIVTKVKSPYSYIVELDGKPRHLHANKMRRYRERIDRAIASNCTVIFDNDSEFGTIQVVEGEHLEHSIQNVGRVLSPSDRLTPEQVRHLTEGERQQLCAVLDKFPTVFADKPGFCPIGEHEIVTTPDFKPRRLRAYKVPEILKPEVDRQIQEMLEQGLIYPSKSAMASPVVCVLKGKYGSSGIRLAIDYRYVNKFSVGDAYPTPDLQDVIQKVGRAKYISTFDAKSGYWQLSVKPESRWLTAFVCDAGLFEFARMPFGLKTAGNTFIRTAQQILHPLRDFTDSFVDDMAVLSNAWSEHIGHVEKFLQVIQDSGLTLNIAKCNFAGAQVRFVGHLVGSGQILPDPVKVATVEEMRPPVTKQEVKRLIGFFSYFRSFIPSFAQTAKVLTDLTRKEVSNHVPWNDIHEQAFQRLKNDLCNAVTLNTVDFSRDFGLLVDASADCVGCCLIQWSDDHVERPIAFASAKLNETQKRWATIEREAFAVIWALRKFRSWLFGNKVIVFSDHNPLSFLTESVPKSAKLARWALALQEYNIDFRYRAAKHNGAADFLSRL